MNENIQIKLNNSYRFRFGQYFKEGFSIFKKEMPLFFTFTTIIATISTLLPLIPLFGGFVNTCFLLPSLSAGFFIAADKISKNEKVRLSNFFEGFRLFKPLALINLTIILLFIFSFVTAVYFLVETSSALELFSSIRETFDKLKDVSEISTKSLFVVILFIVLIPIFIYSLYILSVPLLLFEKNDFWTAMLTSRAIILKKLVLMMLIVLGSAIVFYGIYYGIFFGLLNLTHEETMHGLDSLAPINTPSFSNIIQSFLKQLSIVLACQLLALIVAYAIVPLLYCFIFAFYQDIISENDIERAYIDID